MLLGLLPVTADQHDGQHNRHDDGKGDERPHPCRNTLLVLPIIRRHPVVDVRLGSFLRSELYREFLGLRLSVGVLIGHAQFGLGLRRLVRRECEAYGSGRSGRHVANVLRGLGAGDAVAFDGCLDIGNVALALVHVCHGDGGFLTGVDDVGEHRIAQLETVGLRDRYRNLDVGTVGAAHIIIDAFVFEAYGNALGAAFCAGQCLHRHALRERIACPQRIEVEGVRAAVDGEAFAAVNGHDHVLHGHLAHVLEGETEIEAAAYRYGAIAIGEVGDDDVRHGAGNLFASAIAAVRASIRRIDGAVRSRARVGIGVGQLTGRGPCRLIFRTSGHGERMRHHAGQHDDHRRHRGDQQVDESSLAIGVGHEKRSFFSVSVCVMPCFGRDARVGRQ